MRPKAPPEITIRWFKPDDISALHAIEQRANIVFAQHGMAHIAENAWPLAAFSDFVTQNQCFVAADRDDVPLGFAVCGEAEETFWLLELGVDPGHMRKGIGSLLVNAVVDRARWAFHNAVCLTTFRDLPFNAPFYEKLGFMIADPAKASPALIERLRRETPTGSSVTERVLMFKKL